VHIDDLALVCTSETHSGVIYDYFNGTSMASPHVAGVAALIMAEYPQLTVFEIKERILGSVDRKAGYEGLLLSKGRLNAANAIVSPPGGLEALLVSSTQIDLSWSDTTSNETGFKVERKLGPGGTWQTLATLGPGATAYSDTGLGPFLLFVYRVSALIPTGQTAPSDEARMATPPLKSDVTGTGACFIATVAYGSYSAGEVMVLRRFRDKYLLTNPLGSMFVKLYYKASPPLAGFISRHEYLRAATAQALRPVIFFAQAPLRTLLILLLISISLYWGIRRHRRHG
jgi:hypothetical protein